VRGLTCRRYPVASHQPFARTQEVVGRRRMPWLAVRRDEKMSRTARSIGWGEPSLVPLQRIGCPRRSRASPRHRPAREYAVHRGVPNRNRPAVAPLQVDRSAPFDRYPRRVAERARQRALVSLARRAIFEGRRAALRERLASFGPIVDERSPFVVAFVIAAHGWANKHRAFQAADPARSRGGLPSVVRQVADRLRCRGPRGLPDARRPRETEERCRATRILCTRTQFFRTGWAGGPGLGDTPRKDR